MGTIAGGAQGAATLIGSGFTGATDVWFGPFLGSNVKVNSDTSLTVTPPPASTNEGVQVTVATPDAASVTSSLCVLQLGCPNAYFYVADAPLNLSLSGAAPTTTFTLGQTVPPVPSGVICKGGGNAALTIVPRPVTWVVLLAPRPESAGIIEIRLAGQHRVSSHPGGRADELG